MDFAHALNIHASIKTELFMLVRMRCCPRISAREIGYTVGRRILLRIRIPDRLIRRKKNFRFEGKEENEKIRTIYETRSKSSLVDRVSPMTRLNAASSTRRYSGRNAVESFLRRGTAACAPVKRPVNSRPGRFKVFINDAAAAPRVARHFLLFIQKRAAVEG